MPDDPPLSVRAGYDRWAASYDSDVNRTRDLDAEVLRAAGLPLAGATVIEFGAGTGKNTDYLAAHAARLTAFDLSPAMLDRARARVTAPHVTFVEHDITRPWPVPMGAADLVIGNLVLEHIARLAPVLAEARRALRMGGELYLCELHPYRQWRGAGARTGEARVEAYVHAVSDYLNTALAYGFRLTFMAEPVEAEAAPGALPRLLQMRFVAT